MKEVGECTTGDAKESGDICPELRGDLCGTSGVHEEGGDTNIDNAAQKAGQIKFFEAFFVLRGEDPVFIPEKIMVDGYREGEGFKNKEGGSRGETSEEHGGVEDGEVDNYAHEANEGEGSNLIPTLQSVVVPPVHFSFFLEHEKYIFE